MPADTPAPATPPAVTAPPPPIPATADDLAAARRLAAEIRAERDALHALYSAGVTDLEVGLALVKSRLAANPDASPDAAAIVRDLRAARPALFRPPAPSPARALSPTLAPAAEHDPREPLARAADDA
ncbi:MAG: hypothetical protein ACK4WH_13695, partial [Phycisphaerales bacterium]